MKVCLAAVQAEHMGYLRHLTPWLESKGHEVREQMSSEKYDGLGEADVFIVWNGTEMVGKPDGKVLYAEVGWFPGAPTPGSAVNMYLDRKGINAASELKDLATGRGDRRTPRTQQGVWVLHNAEHYATLRHELGEYTFVPLQMDDDSNVRLHGRGWTNQKLIDHCLRNLEGPFLFKYHPRDRNKYGIPAGCVACGGTIWDWILPATRVVGINSTVLLQAWAVGKPVIALGDTFWACCGDRPWLVNELLNYRQLPFDDIMRRAEVNTALQEVFCEA